jgi:hypothetical protein
MLAQQTNKKFTSVEFPTLKKSAFHNMPRDAHLPQLEHGDMYQNVFCITPTQH